MNEPSTIEVSPEQSEILKKYFKGKGEEKPLSKDEYDKVKDLLDKQRGGLKREVYQVIREDKELVKGALIHQIYRDHRIMDAKASFVRDTLLKALQAPPGEKSLTKEEFKSVAIFLDRQNGGLRRHAYQIFSEDKDIVEASKSHRDAWQSNSKPGLHAVAKEAVENLNKNVRQKGSVRFQDNGMEPGD